jgi:hypothetical protein
MRLRACRSHSSTVVSPIDMPPAQRDLDEQISTSINRAGALPADVCEIYPCPAFCGDEAAGGEDRRHGNHASAIEPGWMANLRPSAAHCSLSAPHGGVW